MHCADGHFDFSTVPNKLMLLKTGKSSFSSASWANWDYFFLLQRNWTQAPANLIKNLIVMVQMVSIVYMIYFFGIV